MVRCVSFSIYPQCRISISVPALLGFGFLKCDMCLIYLYPKIKRPEACVDPTPMVEALEQEKAQLKSEFDSCDAKRMSLERLLQGLEVRGRCSQPIKVDVGVLPRNTAA